MGRLSIGGDAKPLAINLALVGQGGVVCREETRRNIIVIAL